MQLTDWLPTTRKEMDLRGWDVADVIIFSGDAYVDHPSFGAAVLGRLLEDEGYRVCIVPQPSWHGDYRDFKRLGRPRHFFAIAPGCMDSMVNKYTANRRLRSEDAYSPDGRHDMRPEYPTIVYSKILRQLYPDVPIVLGGIEASLRRLTHYDYWQERLRPCILCDAPADLIIYGMGELPLAELCQNVNRYVLHDRPEAFCTQKDFREMMRHKPVRQTVTLWPKDEVPGGIREDDIVFHSHEDCLRNKQHYSENFRHIEEESNRLHPQRIIQAVGQQCVVVDVPFPPMTTEQIDRSFDFPYTRLPHPKYKGKRIPAYEMIKFSVNIHRGCFGGCAFCTISAHQGKFIMSRSKESILREVKQIIQQPDFRGYLSDLGGPSANMYGMSGRNKEICARCRKPSCIHPVVCPNLNADHAPLVEIYRAVDALPGIKKSFIGSGVRYDLLLHPYKDEHLREAAREYTRELILRHVSGRLKVAPEHTSDRVLDLMRKPSFKLFHEFKRIFDRINREAGLHQQIIPYFISSHPGCTEEDMAELATETKDMDFQLEQVQDFTPTPMTVSTETWYSGYHPYTLAPVFSAHTPDEKLRQRMFFFWYKPEERQRIISELRRMNRPDLIERLYPKGKGQGTRGKEQGTRGKEQGTTQKKYAPHMKSNKKKPAPAEAPQKPKRPRAMRFRLWLTLAALAGSAAFGTLKAQETAGNALTRSFKNLEYKGEATVSVSNGNTPLWLTANRYGLSSLDENNGMLRLSLRHNAMTDSAYRWRIGYGADVAVGYGQQAVFLIQQLYADFDYWRMRLTIGAKERPMALKNNELSSGSQTFGINARPNPEVRFGLPEYLNITGRNHHWAAIRGHISYGMMTDGRFQEDYASAAGAVYAKKVLFHTKAGYLRLGNAEKFPLTFEGGLEMATQFGGTCYNVIYGDGKETFKMPHGLGDFVDATFGVGGDATDGEGYANATGNTVGSWLFRLNYDTHDWGVSVYYDHFFEDHSQMFLEYGWRDGLIGVEARLPRNPVVSTLLFEYLRTTDQSGAVYHDATADIPDQISATDNYYNHNLYGGYHHWGQAIGNALYVSPLYAANGSFTFTSNRFRAHHVGLCGDPLPTLHYRLLYTHERSLGTYGAPFTEARTLHSFLAESTWSPERLGRLNTSGWSARLGFALDRGDLIGHNTGVQLSICKRGVF